jgi:two-component system response regulator YesN
LAVAIKDVYKFNSLKTMLAFIRDSYTLCMAVAARDLNRPGPIGKAAVIRDIAASINDNYGEYLTLEILAANYGMNPSYLSLLFKEVMGVNFQEYLSRVRIRSAKKFLASGKFKIGEVAEKTGFNSRF